MSTATSVTARSPRFYGRQPRPPNHPIQTTLAAERCRLSARGGEAADSAVLAERLAPLLAPRDGSWTTFLVLGCAVYSPRPPPEARPGSPHPSPREFEAREPAWRLLHAVTLLKLHQARNRVHMAYHDPKGSREARQARPKDILRAIRLRHTEGAVRALQGHPRSEVRAEGRPTPKGLAPFQRALAHHGHRHPNQRQPPPQPAQRTATDPARNTRHDLHPSGSVPPTGQRPTPTSLRVGHGGAEGRTRRSPYHTPHGARRHRRHSHPRRPRPLVPCGKTHRTGRQAGRRPPRTALCRAPHIVRHAPSRSVRTDRRHAAERHDRKRPLAEPPCPKERSPNDVASNNLRRLQRINSQEVRVSLRVEGDRAPERLQIAADEAARSGDLRTTIEYASGARHAIQLWDEFRVWDPGD